MRTLTGKVISKIGDKTAKISVQRIFVHPIYGKRLKMIKKYLVHDETGAKIGDSVKFVSSHPYSRMKKWKIVKEEKK